MQDKPVWESDFPVEWSEDHFVTRRKFTESMWLVSCASFVANLGLAGLGGLERSRDPLPAMKVAEAFDLPVGGSRVFHYPAAGDACLLVRLGEKRFVAFDQKCTHLGCPVFFQSSQRRLCCPCHEGYFSVEDGRVLAGPPPRALVRIELEIRGGELWATGKVW